MTQRSALSARRAILAVLALHGTMTLAAPIGAQPAPTPAPAAAQGTAIAPPLAADPIAVALAPRPGGLTPEEAGRIAATTRHSVRAKQAELEAAAARVDQALVSYFPRVSLVATYMRLSPVDPLFISGRVIPAVLNSTTIVASLTVPISDYLLRISQGYASALNAEQGKKLEVEAESLKVASDAKLAFYDWVRTKGQAVVVRQAVEQASAHLEDARKIFSVGLSSRADVLRLEAQVASAQQVQAEADAFALLAEEQLRTALGLPGDRVLTNGADVMHATAASPAETLPALIEQAATRRLEIRALDETVLSLKATERVARAGYLPRIDAFADAQFANPNPRILFLLDERFDSTWDVGVRLTWTVNDTFTNIGVMAEARSRVAAVAAQKGVLRDALRLEVASAFADEQKGAITIEAAERGLVSAEESLRVRHELFRNGKATAVDLIDAETEVTRARLSRINARIGLLTARVRLDHATGRDVPLRPVAEAPGR